MGNSTIIAAFDFDGTLTRKDSFIAFAIHAKGILRLLAASILVSPWLVAWKLHLYSGGQAKERLFRKLFKDMSVEKFQKYGYSFVPHIIKMENAALVERLKWHQRQGHSVYIVSASVPDWIEAWAAMYGITRDHIIGTEIEKDDSEAVTGYFSTPNCNGKEKVHRLKQVIDDLDSHILYAYGNSSGDKPLLSISDYPTYIGK